MSSPLRILQLVQTLDPRVGGVALAVLALSRGLAVRGHKVEILVLDDSNCRWLADIDLTVHPLGTGSTNYRYSTKLMPWLRQHGDNYDRVIVHGLWQYVSFAAWRRYARTSTPYFVFPHGMLDPWFKRTFPLKHLKKWLYWPWAEYRVLRDASAVIFTSEEERLQAQQSFWLYRCREKISPLGINAPAPLSVQPSQKFFGQFPISPDKKVLLFLGRLHPKKGCDLVIDAFRKLNPANTVLVLAGPDQIGWEKELRARAEDLPVVFTGMLQGELKQAAFARADAFILPSHQENFGMSVVEALAAGLPVLISNRVNIWREVEGDHAGYVETDDLSGTTRLIERWLGTAEEDRQVMRANARNCFTNRFEINRAVDSLLSILTESRTAR
ncbi:MAG TPA: glycosyltransferase [Chthoniobacterales bacterium]|nr:glycosyltransferase [Chthoniobacterales bacterium]